MKAGKRLDTAGMLNITLLTALIAAGSQIAFPLPLVPINLALLFVLPFLPGDLLKPRSTCPCKEVGDGAWFTSIQCKGFGIFSDSRAY